MPRLPGDLLQKLAVVLRLVLGETCYLACCGFLVRYISHDRVSLLQHGKPLLVDRGAIECFNISRKLQLNRGLPPVSPAVVLAIFLRNSLKLLSVYPSVALAIVCRFPPGTPSSGSFSAGAGSPFFPPLFSHTTESFDSLGSGVSSPFLLAYICTLHGIPVSFYFLHFLFYFALFSLRANYFGPSFCEKT